MSFLSASDCLFCTEDEPCAVHASKPAKKRTRKPSGSAPLESAPRPIQSTDESTSNDWFDAPRKSRFADRAEAAVTLTEDDLILREALRNLEPLMSDGTKARYHDLMYPPKTPDQSRRSAEIRRDRNGSVD